ncbi:MAG: NAD(P)-dependent oxidoreductase [Christensenellales bacterium]
MARIGWVGVGKMGSRMTKRLLDAGHELYVMDVVRENCADIVAAGAEFVETAAALTAKVDFVFSMIPNSNVLEDVYLDKDGVVQEMASGKIAVDMSTVGADASAKVNAAIEKAGGKFIRATVSGSTEYAEKGTLGSMVSGDAAAYEAVLPFLKVLSSRQYYLGENEEARMMKLIVNMMVASSAHIMAECLVMGEALGMDWEKMVDVIADSAGASGIVKFKAESYKKRDFTPMSNAIIMDKDLDLAMTLAKENHVGLPMTSLTRQLYSSMVSSGKGELDYSAILLVYEELNGIKHDK